MERRWSIALVAVLVAACAWAATASAASAKTVWLCKPGQSPDPCTPGLSTTVYSPTLQALRTTNPKPAKKPSFDCFYVYPTVSDQTTTLANRHVDPEESSIALYQAARYSQECRVYAPMYRQVTVPALDSGTQETPAQLKIPVGDVEAAFKDYLKHDNHGRPFVLIGHSQGSFVLEQLMRKLIDPDPQLLTQMMSAILLGGNVLVDKDTGVGGTFRHIPACRKDTDLNCVMAFSTFDQPVPTNSLFGRTTVKGERVLCTNPAALGGGSAVVDPIFPSAPFAPGTLIAAGISLLGITQPQPPTVWTEEPGAYRAQCISSQGASVLQVAPLGGAQTPTPSPDPTWGLHLLDANVELGNLLAVLRHEAKEYKAHPPRIAFPL
jgi:hypothetical protein